MSNRARALPLARPAFELPGLFAAGAGALLLLAAIALGLAGGGPGRWAPELLLAEFYPPEHNAAFEYRFAQPQAQALVRGPADAPLILRLRVMSPPPLPPRELTLGYAGRTLGALAIDGRPRVIAALLPPAPAAGATLALAMAPATAPGDRRELGVLLLASDLRQAAAPPVAPAALAAIGGPLLLFAAVALLGAGALFAGGASLALALALAYGPLPAALFGAALVGGLALDRVVGGRLARQTCRLDRMLSQASGAGRATALATGGFALLFAWLSAASHQRYGTAAYDLGLFDQWIWLISRGLPPYGTGVGVHALGDHMSVIMYLLAPLYWLVPDVRALLALQALAVALGAVALYLIGRARGAAWAGLIAALAFLAHPATHNTILYDFHPDALAGSALLLALLGVETRRWPLVALGCALTLAAKENFAISVAWLGAWLIARDLIERRRAVAQRLPGWLGPALVIAGAAWLALATQLVQPALSGRSQSVFVSRFGAYGGTLPEIALTIVRRPTLLLADLAEPSDLRFVWQVLAPLGLLPLLSPVALLALPALALNLLSDFEAQQTITFHYAALIVPLGAAALLDALVRLRGLRPWRWLVPLACAAVLLGSYAIHSTALVRTWNVLDDLRHDDPRPLYRDYVLAQLPAGASVAAQQSLQPHLTHRAQAFVFPNPFVLVNIVNPAGAPAPLAADYIVYDLRRPDNTAMRFDAKMELLQALQDRGLYHTVVNLDGIVLLRRTDAGLPLSCFGPGWQAAECRVAPGAER